MKAYTYEVGGCQVDTEILYSCTKNCGRSGTFIEMILSKKVII